MYGLQGATNPDAIDQQKATAFVDALTQFDRRMNQVVVDSGILKGIPQGRLKAAGNALFITQWVASDGPLKLSNMPCSGAGNAP